MFFSRPSVGFYSPVRFSPLLAIQNGFKFLDIDVILKNAIRLAFTNFDNFPILKLDSTIFETGDPAGIELLNREISIRRKKISDSLTSNLDDSSNIPYSVSDCEVDMIFVNSDKVYTIKRIVCDVLNPLLLSGDYALHGENLFFDLPRTYIVANNDATPQDLLTRAVKRRNLLQTITDEQEASSIPRKSFHWMTNPFLVPIRQIYSSAIYESVVNHKFVFGEFDLSIQLLMHLGAYAVNEVWNIPENLMAQLSCLTTIEKICTEFKRMLDDGKVIPNDLLIGEEIPRLADQLDEYFSGLHINSGDRDIQLPSIKMCSMNSSPFTSANTRAELSLANKEYIDNPGGKIMIVHEKTSGKKIIFSPISPEISSLYSRGFCNLHYANPGEIAVYGAFVEGEDLPFAYSSYGKISYNYTKEMLLYLGFADGEIIESSRAWNATWAPENTMSVLFSYSHDRLKEKLGDRIRGVLTSINPNLGFSASAFRGIHFEIVSLKPTIFSYQIMNGKPHFCSKTEIAKNLGMQISELLESHHYAENNTPFLPTIELLYLYDKNERRKISKLPIYVVSKDDYLYNR